MKTKKIFNLVWLAIFFTSCTTQTAPKETITLQLSWYHSAEFIGFYVADQLGYYTAENLEVKMVGGGEDIFPIERVMADDAQFGITTADEIIRANHEGKKVTAISAIMRKSPLMLLTMADSGIKKPQDLVGKTVGVISPEMNSTWDIQLLAMLSSLGIDKSTIKFVPNETYSTKDLKSGLMDASSGLFSTNELVVADLDGEAVTAIYYSDYGIDTYINTIFTKAETIKNRPDTVSRFIKATLQGYHYAMENPEKAAKLVLMYDSHLNLGVQQATIEAGTPLIDTGNGPIGQMDLTIWKATQDVLLNQNIITKRIDEALFFTNEFIPK